MLKALLINDMYNEGGGASRAGRELFERLAGHDVQGAMYVIRRNPTDPAAVRAVRLPLEKYLRIFERREERADWRHVGSRLKLGRIGPGDFDVLHLNNIWGGFSLAALRRLARKIPTVWSFHDEKSINWVTPFDPSRMLDDQTILKVCGPDFPHSRHPAAPRIVEQVSGLLPRPHAIITYSNFMHDLVEKSGRWPGIPSFMVRYGVTMLDEPARLMDRAQAKASVGLKPGERAVFLIAAHVSSPTKGMRQAVEAMRRLPADACTCIIAGQGADALASQLPQRSIPLGFVKDNARLAQAYRAADVMICPSICEPFGLVVSEALACETPVAAFKTDGVVEQIGNDERGRLAPLLDVDRLAAAVMELLNDPATAQALGRAGREWVQTQCRIEDSVAGTVRVYHHAIEAFAQAPANAHA